MDVFFIIMVSILVLDLLLAIYGILDFPAQRHSAASRSGRMLYPNACQKYSEVMNQPLVTDASTVEYYKNSYCCYYYNNNYHCYCNYHKSCCQNRSQTNITTNPPSSTAESPRHGTSRSNPYPNTSQDYSEVPKSPPMTDPSIVDYYWYYYCYYWKYHYPNDHQADSELSNPPPMTTESFESDMSHLSPCPNACQDSSVVPKPPPVTDISIVWYYYYHYIYYKSYHYPDGEVRNPPSPTTESSRSAPSSGSSARVPQPMNTGRPRASILKSVYMANSASRIPRPVNRDRLHCRSRPKKVTFGESRLIRFQVYE